MSRKAAELAYDFGANRRGPVEVMMATRVVDFFAQKLHNSVENVKILLFKILLQFYSKIR